MIFLNIRMKNNIFEQTTLGAIKASRKLFRNTWVHRLPITSKIYNGVFSMLYGGVEKEIVFHGIKLLVPTKDTSMVPSIINQDYEQFELDIFRKIVKPGNTVLDIGANLGIYSIIGSKLVGKDGSIHSFEPVPENLKFLRHNVKQNKCTNVVVAPIALSDKKGEEKIFIAKKNVGTHSMGQYSSSKDTITVKTDTVMNYVKINKLNVDIVKMDIEGYEGHVLRGVGKALKKSTVLTEFTASRLKACGDSPKEIAEVMLKMYKFCYVIDEREHKLVPITSANELCGLENSNLLLSNAKINITL
jgi:FkbM family methyltransferase